MKYFSLRLLPLLSLFLLPSCKDSPEPPPEPRPVVVFGTDGFSAEVVKKNPGAFPNLEAMMKDGSYSFEMRTALPSSSGPNWKSILSGVSPELHGHTNNDPMPNIPPRITDEKGKFPGLFRLIREQKPDAITGFFYDWKNMKELYDEGTENKVFHGKGDELKSAAIDFIGENNADLTFIAFDQPDGTGHKFGWESAEYVETCKVMDRYLGEILEAVKKTPRAGETVILFISDHGGKNKSHGGRSLEEMRPMYAMTGEGIPKNYEMKNSLMIYDIPSTIVYYLGLDQPQVWLGRPIVEEEQKES